MLRGVKSEFMHLYPHYHNFARWTLHRGDMTYQKKMIQCDETYCRCSDYADEMSALLKVTDPYFSVHGVVHIHPVEAQLLLPEECF